MLNATVEDPLLDPSPPVFAIAGFEFDQASICRFATSEACGLVGVPEPVGRSIVSIFMDWFVAPDLGCAISLAHHADGRIFRCDVRPTLGGRIHVVLTDISNHLRNVAYAAPDGLTGLVQLGTLTAGLGRMLAAMPPGVRVAVHHIDLHRIRTVNERFGHAVGDRLLIQVAERLRTLVRANGIAARLGGDAFALVQPEVTAVTQAEDLTARLVDLIGRAYVIDGQMLNVGASVGFALSAGETIDADTLLRYAGLALHSAKDEGRGTTRIFEAHMHTRTEARRFLEKDLRLAVAMRQFRLQFQPLYNLADHRVVGFEASLDWTHPVRGAVPPQAFIPLLEEIGLIGQIDKWVLRTACREAAGWPTPASIAVNISSHQFRQSQLVETVTDALASAGLPGNRLELGITGGALRETNLALKNLHSLRALGVRISLDDFGTGSSSLSCFRTFSFDKVRIDRSFVGELGVDDHCAAILRAVCTLSATMGTQTTAKGVETADQVDWLRREGCTEIQGDFTGRPLSGGDARDLLVRQQGEH